MKSKVKGFLIALAVGAAFVAVTVLLNWSSGDRLLTLCDAFTIAGGLLLCYAGIVFSRNHGTFDIFTFSMKKALNLRYKDNRIQEEYPDYRQRKKKERKPATGSLWAGLIYMALAVIAILIFYLR